MIDTPGFDDTSRSDIDTLKAISSYLSISFANGVRINGIIYLHRISDNRLSGSSLRNLRMFKQLTGTGTWPNTVIGTTMWKANDHKNGERREKELLDNADYFGGMLSQGAKSFRIAEHGTGIDEQKYSALHVVSHLLERTKILPTIELQIQRDLVLKGKTLDATAAGKEALGDLYHLQRQLARQLQNAHQDMQEALNDHDAKHAQQLEAIEKDCERKIRESKKEQAKLKISLTEMHDEEVERLQTKLDDMESKQCAVLARKRKELEDMEDSLKHMREQSAIDAARWEKKCLDIATLKKKRRANEKLNRECEESVAAIRHEVAQEETQLQSIGQAKGAMRQNVVNGVANGATAGMTTAFATAGKMTYLCLVLFQTTY